MKLSEAVTPKPKKGDMVEILPGSPPKKIRTVSKSMIYFDGGGDYPRSVLVFDKKVGKVSYWKD